MCQPSSDRKSTRLNSSHLVISYAVFCLKKKTNQQRIDGFCLEADGALSATPRVQIPTLGRLPTRVPVGHTVLFIADSVRIEAFRLASHAAQHPALTKRLHRRRLLRLLRGALDPPSHHFPPPPRRHLLRKGPGRQLERGGLELRCFFFF